MDAVKDAIRIYPLAHPKGRQYLCELCGTPATLQCSRCKVTYYWYVSVSYTHLTLPTILRV